MRLSEKAKHVESSLTRKLFNECSGRPDVINLTLGDPDLLPEQAIRQAAIEAINAGKTRYSANAGIFSLRQSIAKHLARQYGVSADPEKELVVTVGGMEALYLAICCTLNPGDEILIPAPYYVNYVQMTHLCGGIPVVLNTDESTGFVPTKEQLEAAITKKTVAIVVNTPANPTGAVWNADTINAVCELAEKHNLIVIADEVYSSLLYDGVRHESVLTRPGMKDRTILIDSISKRFAMTGYRLGYAFAPAEMIRAMTQMQENVAACAPLPSQYAAIAAYDRFANDDHLATVFRERRDYLVDAINQTGLLSCQKPNGTFYLFVNIEKTGLDSYSFCKALLQQAGVAVAPGVTYGKAYDHYIRIAYTVEIPELGRAMERIREFLSTL